MLWYRSTTALVLASLLLPPLGLALLWTGSAGIVRKLLGTVVLATLTFLHLLAFWGLRVEMAGTGLPTMLTFTTPERRDARVENSRAAMRAETPAVVPEQAQSEATQPGPPPPKQLDQGGAYWSDFRGPGRNGVYDEMPILTKWPTSGLH